MDEDDAVFEDEDFLLQVDSLVQNYSVRGKSEGSPRNKWGTSPIGRESRDGTTTATTSASPAPASHRGGVEHGPHHAEPGPGDEGADDLFEDADFLDQVDSLVQNYSVGKKEKEKERRSESPGDASVATRVAGAEDDDAEAHFWIVDTVLG